MSLSKNFPVAFPSLILDFANSRRLDPRITFTRATPGTYYDGITSATAEQNLILNSQVFENWTATVLGATVTPNTTTAPDGTVTADTIAFGVGDYRYNSFASTSGALTGRTFTFSCWVWTATAKATIGFRISGATTGTDQTVQSVSLTGTATRVSVTRTFTSADTSLICGFDNRVGIGGDGIAGNVIVWGGQLEERATATAYNVTTTSIVTNYIPVLLTAPAGTARFDSNPVTGQSLGLLIEEPRTNLLTYSDQFNDTSWIKNACSISANQIVSPDGTASGDKLVENTTSAEHFIYKGRTGTNETLTLSVFAKAGERTNIRMGFSNFVTEATAVIFNLSTGTQVSISSSGTDYTNVSASITAVGNGWYRCTFTATKNAVNTTNNPYIEPAVGTSFVYLGDGFSGIYLWGAQLETGGFSTSYIATVASPQTRNADSAVMTGTNFSSWFNAGEGTFYIKYAERAISAAHQLTYAVFSADSNNRINIGVNNTNVLDGQIVVNGVDNFTGNTPTLSAQNYQIVFAYATNNAGISANASAVTTDTIVTLPLNLNQFAIGATTVPSQFLNSTIAKIAYYDSRLTNAQLQTLTQS